MTNEEPLTPLERAVQAAKRIQDHMENDVVLEELVALWGKDFLNECLKTARTVRKITWEYAKADNPNLRSIDFEPSPSLVLAVAIRKILKIGPYNRGDFPAKTEGENGL